MKYFSAFTLMLFIVLIVCLARRTSAPAGQSPHEAQATELEKEKARDALYEREGRGDMSGTQAFDDIGKMQVETIARTVSEMQSLDRHMLQKDNGDVPETMRGLLTTLKHQLRDIILAQINANESDPSPREQMKAAAFATLTHYGVSVGEPEAWKNLNDANDPNPVVYGYVLGVEIEQPPLHPDLLVAKTTLAIPCGEDTSFYLFKRNVSGYELALAYEANGYETILGAQNWFAYSLSPPDEAGNFFVVAADVNAWCTSRWQGLRYKIMRIGSSPYEPQMVFRAGHGILNDRDPPFKITTMANGFRLTFWEGQSLDNGIMERRYVLSYALQGDHLKRVAPLAFRPEDFLDEWIHLPWVEAAQWAEPARLAEWQAWHERLQDTNHHCYSDFDSIRRCQAQPNTWQVAVNFSDEMPGQLPPQVFFKISRKHAAFFIEAISTSNDEECSGRNLLDR